MVAIQHFLSHQAICTFQAQCDLDFTSKVVSFTGYTLILTLLALRSHIPIKYIHFSNLGWLLPQKKGSTLSDQENIK